MGKKALSPTTSSILLIILTIVIILIIILWLMGFFSESILKFNAPIDKSCNQVRFEVSLINAEGTGYPEVQISNIGSIQIFDFNLKYIGSKGKSQNTYLGRQLDPGTSMSVEIIAGTVETTKIQVYPILLGSTKTNKNKQKICFDNSKDIILNQFEI